MPLTSNHALAHRARAGPSVVVTVRVASKPVRVTTLVSISGSGIFGSASDEVGSGALTDGTGTVTPSLISVDKGEEAPSVVVIETPAADDVESVASSVVVMLTPASEASMVGNGVGGVSETSGVEKGDGPAGVGPTRLWPMVVVSDTVSPTVSVSLLETAIGIASGDEITVVLPSAYV